jgi:hypothetical protein
MLNPTETVKILSVLGDQSRRDLSEVGGSEGLQAII